MRRALCVGIDGYNHCPLQGCVNDAQRMVSILARHQNGDPNFDCRSLVAPPGMEVVTREALLDALVRLFRDPADLVLFHFSGHGTFNDLDGYLVTQDTKRNDPGVRMADVLRLANASEAREVVVLLDCCSAGLLGNSSEVDNSKALLSEGVSILTASRGDQTSVEMSGGGVFTSLVYDALDGGAADMLGSVSSPSVYAYVQAALGGWDQRPLFKAHLSGLTALRHCTPPVDRTVLRSVVELFPLPAEDLSLDPSYEPTSSEADSTNVVRFKRLQELNRVHLVTPVGAQHMYDAAMQSKSCRLTPSGRYYWRLAESQLI